MIIYWNKINSFNYKTLYNPSYNQLALFLVIDIFPGNHNKKLTDINRCLTDPANRYLIDV